MCFFKTKTPQMQTTTPQPEKTADPQEIGGQRTVEDQQLFGDQGQTLRVNRDAVGAGVAAGGSGLRMM